MSKPGCIHGQRAARAASPAGTPASMQRDRRSSMSAATRPVTTRSRFAAMVSIGVANSSTTTSIPNEDGRWRSSHPAARSVERRASRNRLICVSSGTDRSSASIVSHWSSSSTIRRAAMKARSTSATVEPVSSVIRWSKLIPARLTMVLTIDVVMISRRNRCPRSVSGNRSRRAGGKYASSSESSAGSSGRSVSSTSVMSAFLV